MEGSIVCSLARLKELIAVWCFCLWFICLLDCSKSLSLYPTHTRWVCVFVNIILIKLSNSGLVCMRIHLMMMMMLRGALMLLATYSSFVAWVRMMTIYSRHCRSGLKFSGWLSCLSVCLSVYLRFPVVLSFLCAWLCWKLAAGVEVVVVLAVALLHHPEEQNRTEAQADTS